MAEGRHEAGASSERCNVCGSAERRFARTEDGWGIYKCKACTVYFVSPTPKIEADEGVLYYVGDAGEPERHRKSSVDLWQYGVDLLARFTPSKGLLIDVGAGFGFFVKAAAEAGWNAVGVETSPREVNYARESLGLNVQRGTIVSADFAPASAAARRRRG